jgi:quercetin dioxygenase-like cupin family protein
MNNLQPDKDNIESDEQADVFAMLAEHLSATPSGDIPLEQLGQRLSNRIQASIASHAGLRTVRSRDGIWKNLVSGIRYKSLWQGERGHSVLIEFAPGASLPVHRHHYLEEGIVLSGGLQMDDLELNQFDYHFSPAGSHHGQISSKQGAIAYLRGSSVGQPMVMLKELLGGLLPKNEKSSQSVMANQDDWFEVQEGLSVRDLWTDGTVVSRFCRLAPGTHLAGHYHPIDEECMMLNGEVFLGDILVQAGDYHFAPARSKHLGITSDTGALFFVRGAV